MQNRQLIFLPKIQYELAAERSEAASNSLRFSKMFDHGRIGLPPAGCPEKQGAKRLCFL